MHDLVRHLLVAPAIVGLHWDHYRQPRAAERAGAALWRLGAVDPIMLLDSSSMMQRAVDKSMLQRSLSGDYGASGAGCGRRDAGPSCPMQDVAVCRRDGRWSAATDVY